MKKMWRKFLVWLFGPPPAPGRVLDVMLAGRIHRVFAVSRCGVGLFCQIPDGKGGVRVQLIQPAAAADPDHFHKVWEMFGGSFKGAIWESDGAKVKGDEI